MKKLEHLYIITVLITLLISGCGKDEILTNPVSIVPTSPKNLTSSAANTIIILNWQVPDNIGSSAITSYRIYRGLTSGGQTYHKTISGNILSYIDSNLTNNTTYYYFVTALNNSGESNRSNEVNAMPRPNPVAPSEPTNISAISGNNKITLSWNSPVNNGGAPILGYKIYRGNSTNNLTLLISIDTVGPNILDDLTVTNFNSYYYSMTCFNYVGESIQSTPLMVMPSNYDQLSINGRITFPDTTGYYKFTDTSKGYYNVSAFSQWPPVGNASASSKIFTKIESGKLVADYKIIVPANGFYTVTSAYIRLPYVAGSVFGMGKYGSDTSHSPAQIYDTTNARVSLSGNAGVGGINFLSWVDTTKKIYKF